MRERVALILPAFNEEQALAATLDSLAGQPLAQVIVVDNGSTDRTAEVARRRGAQVVSEPRRGYGQACLAGIAALRPDISVVAFMDADGSDDPRDLPGLLAPVERGEADLAIGSRVLGESEPGALTPQQRFGNWLATTLVRWLYRTRYTDLGPFRAIRRDALAALEMRDTTFGWTVEMQIKAARHSLRMHEIAVRYRRRQSGQSKISGTFRGTILAGAKILWTILRHRF